MKKRILYAIAGLFGLLAILILRPVSVSDESDCHLVEGTVVKIHEGGENDIVFRLKNDSKIYYINRGLEAGLTLDGVSEKVMAREVSIWYAKHWTPLDPTGRINHISKVTLNEEVLFTEF